MTLTSIPGIEVATGPISRTEGLYRRVLPEPNVTTGSARRGPGYTRDRSSAVGDESGTGQAILLTGGSAFGLAAADGVVRGVVGRRSRHPTRLDRSQLSRRGRVRPAARGWRPASRAEEGAAAFRAASSGPVDMGLVGAGTGTSSAKWRGFEFLVKSGIGSAAVDTPEGHKVAAIVVLNPVGDVFTLEGEAPPGITGPPAPGLPPQATVRQTNPRVVWRQRGDVASRLTGLRFVPRALGACLRPAHTRVDGDVVFVSSIGNEARRVDLAAEGAFVATGRAIEAGLKASL